MCVSVSLLSIFDVFHCQLWIKVGLTIKAHPDALKARTRLMLLAALIIIIILFRFRRKTQRAAQTVRPRDLKLCQW